VAAVYLAPDARYSARFAAPLRRLAAAAIDWGLLYVAYLLVSIPLGGLEALGFVLLDEGGPGAVPGALLAVGAQVMTLAPVVAYFAVLLASAQTIGMRALDIHAVVASTGRAPRVRWRGLVRGLAAAVQGTLVFVAAGSLIGDAPIGGYSERDQALLEAVRAAAAAIVAAKLWLLVDPRRQSLQDRVFGLVVIEDATPAVPMRRGPWGSLDHVDLSARADAPTGR
jgi:uncharacterized RDD family membrane protein YckC